MWRDLRAQFGEGPMSYVCGCGPQAGPGAKRIEVDPFKAAVLRSI